MNDDVSIPAMLILLGVCAVTIYVLTIALRDAVRRISRMNERLLVLAAVKDGNDAAGRALVAMSKSPKKVSPGIAKKDDGAKPGDELKVTVGLG